MFPGYPDWKYTHLYLYHVLNTSESTIAKRRLYGTMISYNSPPYTTSDLYENYAELQNLIDEYHEAVLQDPLRSERLKAKIFELAKELRNEEKHASELDKIDKNCAEFLECYFEESIESAIKKSKIDSKHRKELKKTLAFGIEVAENYADNSTESQSCLRGLDTEFIEPSIGGDVVRTPDYRQKYQSV